MAHFVAQDSKTPENTAFSGVWSNRLKLLLFGKSASLRTYFPLSFAYVQPFSEIQINGAFVSSINVKTELLKRSLPGDVRSGRQFRQIMHITHGRVMFCRAGPDISPGKSLALLLVGESSGEIVVQAQYKRKLVILLDPAFFRIVSKDPRPVADHL